MLIGRGVLKRELLSQNTEVTHCSRGTPGETLHRVTEHSSDITGGEYVKIHVLREL